MSRNDVSDVNFRSYRTAVLLGVACALCVAAGCFVMPVLLFFAPFPLLFVYCIDEPRCGLCAALVASLATALFCPLKICIDTLLCLIAPSMMLGSFLNDNIVKNKKTWWYPESFLLRNFVIVYFIAAIVLSFTVFPESYVDEMYRSVFANMEKLEGVTQQQIDSIKSATEYLKPYYLKFFLGFEVIVKMFMVAINLRLAHALGKKIAKNIRSTIDLRNIRISHWMAVSPMVFFTLSQIFVGASYLLTALFVVTLFAPLIAGFSVGHYFFASFQHTRFWNFIFILFSVFFPLVIALLGFVDSFYSLRAKINAMRGK
jgi:hypothetical protein